MDAYETLIQYLNRFAEDDVVINKQEMEKDEALLHLSKRNKVLSIVQYLNGENQKEFKVNQLKHYARIESCMNLFNTLDNLHIPYAVIKGAYLDKVAYKNIGVRRYRYSN